MNTIFTQLSKAGQDVWKVANAEVARMAAEINTHAGLTASISDCEEDVELPWCGAVRIACCSRP